MKYTLLIITMLSANIILAQTTFYVDASEGDDSNSGISVSAAWQTIEMVNSQSFGIGDSLLFKRDEVWKGTRLYISSIEGTDSSPVVYGSYGTGEKPILSSIIAHSHTWSEVGGNVWKANNPPSEHPERLVINGEEKLRANIQSELDGINYFWFYDNNTNDLFLYSTVDPNSFLIEYTSDFPLIIGYSNNIVVQDLDLQGGWTAIYISTLAKNIHLTNLQIGKYSREGLIIGSGSDIPSEFPHDILVENCTFDAFFAFDYSSAEDYDENSDRGSSDGFRAGKLINAEIRNCYFKNWGHASISLTGDNPMDVTSVSMHNNYLTSPDICYGGRVGIDNVKQNEFYNNLIINTSVQSQLSGQNNHIHHNIFYGTTDTPLVPEIVDAAIEVQSYSNSDVYGNVYEHNLILNTEGPAFRFSGNNEHNIYENVVRNNIFYNCGILINGEIISVEEDDYASTYDNLFLNNLVYGLINSAPVNFRGSFYNIDEFNTLTGTDGYVITDNISDNPLFVDESAEDYHLQNNSVCINAGSSPLATQDFEGNTIPYPNSLPDIGIYEYQGVNSTSERRKENGFFLYPNPSIDEITISDQLINREYQIISPSGKEVKNGELRTNKIDIANLPFGIYFIVIAKKEGKKQKRFKFIKK